MSASNFFNYRFNDSELETRFERFIDNNIPELFSYFGQTNQSYTMSWVDVKGIVNADGKYRQTLVELANMIQIPAGNRSGYKDIHMANIFLTMHLQANGNFTRLMQLIRKFLKQLPQEDYKYNVVWYAEYLPSATTFD